MSVGVISEQKSDVTDDDVVFVVWYSESERKLLYSYYTDTVNTLLNKKGDKTATGWSNPITVFSGNMVNAGEYCKTAVDEEGGVHIACYDPINLDLCYAYLPSSKRGKPTYQTDFQTCVVDTYGVTGSNITIDVAKTDANGYWRPYIGYYAEGCSMPKLAWQNTADVAPMGSSNDHYTKSWECSVVPTSRTADMQSTMHNDINVAVWKTDTGVLKAPAADKSYPTKRNERPAANDGEKADSDGKAYGNSTGNPILGYSVNISAGVTYIETAQMR